MKIKIGIIGCGTIGSEIAKSVIEKFDGKATLEAIADMDKSKAREFIKSFSNKEIRLLEIDDLIQEVDLVIEAATAEISYNIAKKSLMAGKDVLIISVGGLVGEDNIFLLAEEKNCKIYIPTGAICGIDCVKAAKVAGITSAMIITRKPPKGLSGAPYIIENNIDLDSIDKETVIFEGTALQAVTAFPKNINVAATLSYAGIGLKETKVKIITSKQYVTNSHEIIIEGAFGTMTAKTSSIPSPQNPQTSYLAILSIVSMLEQILSNVKIGT